MLETEQQSLLLLRSPLGNGNRMLALMEYAERMSQRASDIFTLQLSIVGLKHQKLILQILVQKQLQNINQHLILCPLGIIILFSLSLRMKLIVMSDVLHFKNLKASVCFFLCLSCTLNMPFWNCGMPLLVSAFLFLFKQKVARAIFIYVKKWVLHNKELQKGESWAIGKALV